MDFIGYKMASDLIGIPIGTLYSWVSQKQVPHHRLGKRLIRFKKSELLDWLESHKVQLNSK